MATRLYLTSNNWGGVTAPSFDASWEDSAPSFSNARFWALPYKVHSPFTTLTNTETNVSTTFDSLGAAFITPPIKTQTIQGTVKGIIRVSESDALADMRAQMVIRVITNNGGSTRGTLIASDGSALSNEFATSLTNRKYPLNWSGSGQTVTPVTSLSNHDRIIIEIGWRSHEASATSRTGTVEFGDASASDLAEDEVGTSQFAPWIEFSQDIQFTDMNSVIRGGETFDRGYPRPAGIVTTTTVIEEVVENVISSTNTSDNTRFKKTYSYFRQRPRT